MVRKENRIASRASRAAATPDCYTGAAREVGQHTGLQRRGARYYLRVRVPEPLRPLVGKREVTKALGTADYRTAVERLHQARVEVDALFKAARRQLARAEAEAAPEPSQQVVVEAVRGWLAKAERAALACPLPPDQAQDILDSTRLDAAAFGSADAVEDPSIQGLAREIVEALGYRLRDGSPAFWLAASLTARAG